MINGAVNGVALSLTAIGSSPVLLKRYKKTAIKTVYANFIYRLGSKLKGEKMKTEFINNEPPCGKSQGIKPNVVSPNKNDHFLLFGKYFGRHETCCVVSHPGVGKTLLACYIAKNSLLKKVVYFELDDGYNQKDRLEQVDSIYPVYLPEFETSLDRLIDDSSYKCWLRAVNDTIMKPNTKIEDRMKRHMRSLMIQNIERIDELLLFEIYIDEAIHNGAEMIILDTLQALGEFPWKITRKYVRRISKKCREKRIPLLLLHHTTKQGIYSGSSGLAQVVDTLLYLEKLPGNLRKITVKKNRFSQEGESCLVEMIPDGPHAARFELCEESILHTNSGLTSLEGKIVEVMENKESITFDELVEALGLHNKGSIKNYLKKLEDKGLIAKADGRTWNKINIC